MFTVVLGALANLILDPIFIFVFDLGVAGAAIATVLSQLLSCIFAVSFSLWEKSPGDDLLWKLQPPSDDSDSVRWTAAFSHSGYRQFNSHHPEYRPVQNGRKRSRPAHYCRYDRPELYGYDHRPHAGHQQRNTGYYQLQLRRLPAGSSPPGGEKNPAALPGLHSFHVSGIRLLPEFFVRLFTRDAAAVSVSVWGIHTFTLGIIPLSFQYVLVDGLTAMGRTKTALILSILRKGTYITAAVVLAVLVSARSSFYAEPLSDLFTPLFPLQSFFWFLKNIWKSEKRNASQMPDNTKKPLSADHFRT